MDQPFLPVTTHDDSSSRRTELSSTYIDVDSILPLIKSPNSSSYANILSSINRTRRKLTHRSHSAPSLISQDKESNFTDSLDPRPAPRSSPLIVRQAFLGVAIYLVAVVVIFMISGSFKGTTTVKPVDALYFTVVTLCTIGFGDIVPDSTFTKLFTCASILVGFGFVDILLNGLVTYICDRQEAVMLSAVDGNRFNTYMIDRAKGRMRIRTKVCVALVVVIGCIATVTVSVHFLEEFSWVDSFYLSVTSVTTVGYVKGAFFGCCSAH